MSGVKGFPKVFASGFLSEQPYIIQQKLGLTLNELLKKNRKHFSLKTVLTIGICLIDLIKKFHDKGFIHNDIKPDNIMIGDYKTEFSEMNQLYIIDFGISSSYLDEQGSHKPFNNYEPFRGNAIFSSKNAFARISLSRRDDIISLVYLLNYLIDTRLEWVKFNLPVPDQFE